MIYNLILLYPKNFKKSARALPDKLLLEQLRLIYLIREYLFGDVSENACKDNRLTQLVDYYEPMLKWLYVYQLELIKEFEFRFERAEGSRKIFEAMIKKLKKRSFPMHNIYGKHKWEPCWIQPDVYVLNPEDISDFARLKIKRANSKYMNRKPPKGI